MTTRITFNGRVTIPKAVREALELGPGDGVEFTANGAGEIVLSKKVARGRAPRLRIEALTRRRAAELLRLLRGLD